MKSIILPLLVASVGIAEAGVYKCLDASTGSYTYQGRPCKDQETPAENKIKIAPTNQKRVDEAVKKLENDLKAHQAKKDETTQNITDKKETVTKINVTLPAKSEIAPATDEQPLNKAEDSLEIEPIEEEKIPRRPDDQPETAEEINNQGS